MPRKTKEKLPTRRQLSVLAIAAERKFDLIQAERAFKLAARRYLSATFDALDAALDADDDRITSDAAIRDGLRDLQSHCAQVLAVWQTHIERNLR